MRKTRRASSPVHSSLLRRGGAVALAVTLGAATAVLTAGPAQAVDLPLPTGIAGWGHATGTDGRVYIADAQGRALQLHGGNHKTTDPDTLTDELLTELVDRGLDHIRLAIYWDLIEPTQGTYEEAYLAKVDAALERAEAHGVLVILDMHQDVFGPAFGDHGMPLWATRTDGVPFTHHPVWLENYLEPAVQNAFDHLYEDADLRQAQLDVWTMVVERVHEHPAVLGYDLMNEPFGKIREGEDFLTAAARVEREQLTPMFQRLTDAISAIDPIHWVFFEPPNLASLGIPTSLGEVHGPRVALYPHMYDASIETATYSPDGKIQYDPAFFAKWANAISTYTDKYPIPMLVGEWGIAHPELPGMDAFVRDSLSTLDGVTSGWSVFNWCMGDGYCPIDENGDDRAAIDQIFAPYARAIAGAPTSSTWDPATGSLRVVYRDNAATGTTEIFLPVERYYSEGYVVETSDGAGAFTSSYDEATGVLSLTVADTGTDHAICVTPDGAPQGCVVPVEVAPTTSTTTPSTIPVVNPAFTG